MADMDASHDFKQARTETRKGAGVTAALEKRKKAFVIFGIVLAVLAIGYGIYWFAVGRRYVSTDNAYVAADLGQITPQVAAPVAAVPVIDTQKVRKGDVLVRLDASDARIALAAAKADLAQAVRQVEQTMATSAALSAQITARKADIAQANAKIATARSALDKARIDLQRRNALAADGAVSGEELTTARNAYDAAKANLTAAQAELAQANATRATATGQFNANEALVRGTSVDDNPEVLAARARVEKARLDLDRTVLRAPFDGVVSQRKVQIGQQVSPGATLMTIVPLNRLYVNANFKEVQLRNVRPGQPVELTSDLYGGDVVYHGQVAGFDGGTGSAFALIPAQNATGNWIKVVQRLPVRITLDPRELARHPLRVGLSMDVSVDIRSRN